MPGRWPPTGGGSDPEVGLGASDVDGRQTGGSKGIAYLRDHFEPEMSIVATERLEAEAEIATVAGATHRGSTERH